MRVTCRALAELLGDPGDPGYSSITIGAAYVVLCLYVGPGETADLRILDDRGSPTVWPINLFTSDDQKTPDNWVVRFHEDGGLDLGPAEWLEAGFWEDFFDGKPQALDSYERSIRDVVKEEAYDLSKLTLPPRARQQRLFPESDGLNGLLG